MLKLIDVATAAEEHTEFNGYTVTIRWGEFYADGRWFWMTGVSPREYAEISVIPRTGEIKSFSIKLIDKVNPTEETNFLVSCPNQIDGLPRFQMDPEPTRDRYFVRESLPLIAGLSDTMMRLTFGEVRPISTCIYTTYRVRFGIDEQNYLNVIEISDITSDEMVLVKQALIKEKGRRRKRSQLAWLRKLLRFRGR